MPDPNSNVDPFLELLDIFDPPSEENQNISAEDQDLLSLFSDPDKKVSKSTYQKTETKFVPYSKNSGRGSWVTTKGPEYTSDLDEAKYTKTLNNGDTVNLSLVELSDPKKNPELDQYMIDKEEEFNNPDLFKKIEKQETYYVNAEPYTTTTFEQPYEKELNNNRAVLNELSEKGLMHKIPKEFRWDNDLSNDNGVLEVTDENT